MLKINSSSNKSFKRESHIDDDDLDKLDRVNYNDQSHSQDHLSHYSHNKSALTSRKSPLPVTERKREDGSSIHNMQNMQNKIEHYKKIIDKKINEMTTNAGNKTMNKSQLGVDNTHLTNDRSSSNHSFITKDKTIDHDTSKSHRKNDSLIKNLDNATKKVLSKENYKSHHRHSSMEVKYTIDGKINTKSPNSNVKNMNLTKNIHAMKEMLFSNNNTHNPNQTLSKNLSKNTHNTSSYKNSTNQPSNINPSNIILNQGGIPCFNNINIYTTNNSNNIKANEINLRQYIFNKVNKPKSMAKIGPGHIRSTSNNNH